MARVLVLDGHSPAGLAFTRSLGRAKHWVAVGSNHGISAPAASSRYCQLSFTYPVPSEDASAFVEAVFQFVRRNHIELILPMTDWTVLPLSKYRNRFDGLCCIAVGPDSALQIAADKFRTITLARELGIAVPETSLIRSLEELDGVSGSSKFPVVVKDRFSLRWEGDRAIAGSVGYAYSQDDLRQKVAERLQRVSDVLIQQFVPGEGIGFSALAIGASAFLPFMWLRVRETDPRGAGSAAAISIPIIAELKKSSEALIARAGLEGVCMVEFKRPRDGGAPVLMEINARPWGSMPLAIACGVDYPFFFADWILNGKRPPPEIQYKRRILCRRLVNDLTHLEHTYHGTPTGWPIPYPGFLRTLFTIAMPWYPGMRYADLWLSDPAPGWAGLEGWFRGHFPRSKSSTKASK
jgi:predicted ATP-grasp superfamily ATP-dependent carboligase